MELFTRLAFTLLVFFFFLLVFFLALAKEVNWFQGVVIFL